MFELTDSQQVVVRVRRGDLQLILDGLDEHWITCPGHQPAIERLRQAVREKEYTWHHDPGATDARLQKGYYSVDNTKTSRGDTIQVLVRSWHSVTTPLKVVAVRFGRPEWGNRFNLVEVKPGRLGIAAFDEEKNRWRLVWAE